jgi:hypothetical protein
MSTSFYLQFASHILPSEVLLDAVKREMDLESLSAEGLTLRINLPGHALCEGRAR